MPHLQYKNSAPNTPGMLRQPPSDFSFWVSQLDSAPTAAAAPGSGPATALELDSVLIASSLATALELDSALTASWLGSAASALALPLL